jgi:hypothetical protein
MVEQYEKINWTERNKHTERLIRHKHNKAKSGQIHHSANYFESKSNHSWNLNI